jgi:hypothetical protein
MAHPAAYAQARIDEMAEAPQGGGSNTGLFLNEDFSGKSCLPEHHDW